jgi:hypothetical protein
MWMEKTAITEKLRTTHLEAAHKLIEQYQTDEVDLQERGEVCRETYTGLKDKYLGLHAVTTKAARKGIRTENSTRIILECHELPEHGSGLVAAQIELFDRKGTKALPNKAEVIRTNVFFTPEQTSKLALPLGTEDYTDIVYTHANGRTVQNIPFAEFTGLRDSPSVSAHSFLVRKDTWNAKTVADATALLDVIFPDANQTFDWLLASACDESLNPNLAAEAIKFRDQLSTEL